MAPRDRVRAWCGRALLAGLVMLAASAASQAQSTRAQLNADINGVFGNGGFASINPYNLTSIFDVFGSRFGYLGDTNAWTGTNAFASAPSFGTPLGAPSGGAGANVATAGAVADGQQATTTATMAAGTNTLTVSTPIFGSLTKVGQQIGVQGAGPTPTTGYISSIPVTTQGGGYQAVATVTLSGSPTTAAQPGVLMGVVGVTQTGAGAGCPTGSGNAQLSVQHTPMVNPNVSYTVASGAMTAVSLANQGAWLNDYPFSGGSPALTNIPVIIAGCTTYPTVTISMGVVGFGFGHNYWGTSRGAGYSTSGVTATISGGTPTAAAVAGTPVIGTWTPPLDTTIASIVSPYEVTLAANASTGLAAATTNITWGTLNTSTIQGAVNMGGTVAFPPGPGCYLTDKINLVSNETLWGWGNACLLMEPGSYNPLFSGAGISNVEIASLTGTGNVPTFISPASGSSFVAFSGSTNVRAHDLKAYSWNNHDIVANSSTTVRFIDNFVNGSEFGGGVIVGSDGSESADVQLNGNTAYNTQLEGVGGTPVKQYQAQNNKVFGSNLGWGDSVSGTVADCYTGYTTDPWQQDVDFENNQGFNCGNNGMHVSGNHLTLKANKIIGHVLACILAAGAPSTLPPELTDLDVEGNTCVGAVSNVATQTGIVVRDYQNATVKGNPIDTEYEGVLLQGVPTLVGNLGLSITDNPIHNTFYCIHAEQKLQSSYIGGNICNTTTSDMILFDNTNWSGAGGYPNFYNVIGPNVGYSIGGKAFNEVSGDYNIVSRQMIAGVPGTITLTGSHSSLGVAP